MGDLPDWTRSVSNAGTTIFSAVVNDGVANGFNVAGNGGLLLRMSGLTNNDTVVAKVEFFTDSTLAVSMGRSYYTAAPVLSITSTIIAEVPVYAGWVVITNLSGQQCTVRLTVAARTVTQPRVLSSSQGARVFGFTGAMSTGVSVPLVPQDGGDSTWANNGQVTAQMQLAIAGAFEVNWVDQQGNLRLWQVAQVPGNATTIVTLALPQGALAFSLIPLANSAGATAVLTLAQAQL